MTITIGVDPGITGAIALVDSYRELVTVHDIPVAGGQLSIHGINLLEAWDDGSFGTVVIEDVHAMPPHVRGRQQGVSSAFNFGRTKGALEGIFATHELAVRYVSPAKWKKALGLTADKGSARRRAMEMWPSKARLFARVKDDGRAEAALIAHWWLTHGEGQL